MKKLILLLSLFSLPCFGDVKWSYSVKEGEDGGVAGSYFFYETFMPGSGDGTLMSVVKVRAVYCGTDLDHTTVVDYTIKETGISVKLSKADKKAATELIAGKDAELKGVSEFAIEGELSIGEFSPKSKGVLTEEQQAKIYNLVYILAMQRSPIKRELANASVLADQASNAAERLEAFRKSKIEKLELNQATFEEALGVIQKEWLRQHPSFDFPVALGQYGKDEVGSRLITLSLHDVPFIVALKYIGQTSGRRMIQKPDLLTMQDVGEIVEDWNTKTYHLSPKALKGLKLSENPTSKEIIAAYSRFGVHFQEWMQATYRDGVLLVHASELQHEQIPGINFLLSEGFVISKEGEQADSGQPSKNPTDEVPSQSKAPSPALENIPR